MPSANPVGSEIASISVSLNHLGTIGGKQPLIQRLKPPRTHLAAPSLDICSCAGPLSAANRVQPLLGAWFSRFHAPAGGVRPWRESQRSPASNLFVGILRCSRLSGISPKCFAGLSFHFASYLTLFRLTSLCHTPSYRARARKSGRESESNPCNTIYQPLDSGSSSSRPQRGSSGHS